MLLSVFYKPVCSGSNTKMGSLFVLPYTVSDDDSSDNVQELLPA